MNARLVLVACATAVYCAGAPSVRWLYPWLANPTACAQRAEAIAQAVLRAQALTNAVRRS